MRPVSQRRIEIAKQFGLQNVESLALASRAAGVPFAVACALIEKESKGRNVYGHDVGGALSGFPGEVNRDNFAVFRWLVIDQGYTSNGVGPCQITYAGSLKGGKRDGGFFREMEAQRLKPYDVFDNMFFGLSKLKGYHVGSGSWETAGTRYNGASSYGKDLVVKIGQWRQRLAGGAA